MILIFVDSFKQFTTSTSQTCASFFSTTQSQNKKLINTYNPKDNLS